MDMDKIDPTIRTPEIITGGVYRKTRIKGANQEPEVLEGVIVATRTLPDGRRQGELQVFRERAIVVSEHSQSFVDWALVAVPRDLETPVGTERIMAENERLQAEIAALKAEEEKAEEDAVVAEIIRLRDDEEKSWGDIGKAMDMHHHTARTMYLKATKAS